MKKAYIGNPEEDNENIRALEEGYVQWHVKKAYIGNSF
jgi:hypothetical protein